MQLAQAGIDVGVMVDFGDPERARELLDRDSETHVVMPLIRPSACRGI
jgi:hypothetical protein